MKLYTIAVSTSITASAAACYAALVDYRSAHANIIPPKYLGPLTVLAGGTGEGTRISCSLKILGRTVPFIADVTEPVPGRVLVETIPDTGAVTMFTVAEQSDSLTRVTIESRLPRSAGLRGAIERAITRRVFTRMFQEELNRLAAEVNARVVGDPVIRFG